MTIMELEEKLEEIGVPKKVYAVDGKPHIERECAIEKHFRHYEVFTFCAGYKYFVKKFKTEEEACQYFFNKIVKYCLSQGMPLNGYEPLRRTSYENEHYPKYLHEVLKFWAKYDNFTPNYSRGENTLTFDSGYTFHCENFFHDRYYKGNAIICLSSTNRTMDINDIKAADNVFMINDKGDVIWKFKRCFIFPDRKKPVNNIGLNYEKDELYLYVYDDKHHRPKYTVDPSTGKLKSRYCMFKYPSIINPLIIRGFFTYKRPKWDPWDHSS